MDISLDQTIRREICHVSQSPWVLSTSLMSHAVGYYKSPLCSSECCLSSLKVSNCYFDNWLEMVGWYILHHFTMELACDGHLEVPYLQVDSESNSWPKPRVELQLWAWQRGQCQFLKAVEMCTIDAGESPFSVKPASECVSNRNLYIVYFRGENTWNWRSTMISQWSLRRSPKSWNV